MKSSPKYQHDCTSCIFIGQTIGGKVTVDLYYHGPNFLVSHGTLIARVSDEGSNYLSCPVELARPSGHSELWAAKALFEREKESWPAMLTKLKEAP